MDFFLKISSRSFKDVFQYNSKKFQPKTKKMKLLFSVLILIFNLIVNVNCAHHICLLGLSGTKSNMITISRDIILNIRKIDSYAKFTILTRDLERGNKSYSDLSNVNIVYGSMLNISDIKLACSNSDIGIFTSPTHPTLDRIEISKIVLNGFEEAGIKYFVYTPGSLNVQNSYHNTQELYKFLRHQVLYFRFKDYAIISTGGWMELYFPQDTLALLSTLPVFLGINLPFQHQYSSMRDIGPVTALVLYRVLFRGQYHISTHKREFEIYDSQAYSAEQITHLLSTICQKQIYNFGQYFPYIFSTLQPVFKFLKHDRLTYLSELFSHYLSHPYTAVPTHGYYDTITVLGYTPTTVRQYFEHHLLGTKIERKVSKIEKKANEIRKNGKKDEL